MNLSNSPTKAQLGALFAAADDDAGHHILWIDKGGEVHLTLLDDSVVLTEFATAYPEVRVRFPAFCVGNGYVGPEAAGDPEHINQYYNWLRREWAAADGAGPGEIFAD